MVDNVANSAAQRGWYMPQVRNAAEPDTFAQDIGL
jgi:hypothetical protein